MKRGITFGCWDLLHFGHIKFLKQASSVCDFLIVGVPTDAVIVEDKNQEPVISFILRIECLKALKVVNRAAPYFHLEFLEPLKIFNPDVLIIGEQWGSDQRHKDAENWMLERNREVIRIPYTQGISTTQIKQRVIDQWQKSSKS